jgi:hypothetical protein
MADAPGEEPAAAEPPARRKDRNLIIALIVLVAALAAALLFTLANDDDEDDVATGDTTSSTLAETSTSDTTEPPTSAPDVPDTPSDEELATVVWPGPDSGVRYSTPEAAARGFAVQVAKFADPVIGEFQQGDSRSGEFEVRPTDSGPVTTVLVRQLSDDGWWVLAALTDNIVLDEPAAGDTVTSPITLTGTSDAFEGTVNVEVLDLGATSPIGEAFVTGGGNGQPGPFSGEISYQGAAGPRGVILLFTLSAEDGRVLEASAVPVVLGDA